VLTAFEGIVQAGILGEAVKKGDFTIED